MTMSDYLRELRAEVGPRLLVLPSVSGVVLDGEGQVLLVRHSDRGVWVVPGGAVDPDEAPQDAVVRELWEETGLWVEPRRLLGVFGGAEFRVHYRNGDKVSYVMATYECVRRGGHLRPDGQETLEARFFPIEQLQSLEVSPWVNALLPALLNRSLEPWLPPATWKPPGRRP